MGLFHASEYCYPVVLCCIMSSMVNCFFRLSNYLTLSVDYEKHFFGLSKEFFGKRRSLSTFTVMMETR